MFNGRHVPTVALGLLLLASVATAHSGVTNPAVLARMDAMKSVGKHMGVLGDMAKGKTGFSAAQARESALAISQLAETVPDLFEARETDPKSEALPIIWESYGDFTNKARDMENVALRQAQDIDSLDSLRVAMIEIGGTCKACHARYRE